MATQQPQHTNHDSDLFQDTFPNQRSFLGLMIHINKGLKWVSNIQWTGQKMYYDKHLMMIMGPLVQSREAQHLGLYSSQWTGKYSYERLEDNRQLLEFNYCLWHGCVTYSLGTSWLAGTKLTDGKRRYFLSISLFPTDQLDHKRKSANKKK